MTTQYRASYSNQLNGGRYSGYRLLANDQLVGSVRFLPNAVGISKNFNRRVPAQDNAENLRRGEILTSILDQWEAQGFVSQDLQDVYNAVANQAGSNIPGEKYTRIIDLPTGPSA